jgi:hypothetical protein
MPFNAQGYGPLTTPFFSINRNQDSTDYIVYEFQNHSYPITLTNDLVARDIILQGAVVINTAGFKIRCRNLTMIRGLLGSPVIQNNGGNTGLGAPAGSLCGGADGGSGGHENVGGVNGAAKILGGLGGAGGDGGAAMYPGGSGGLSHVNYVGSNIDVGCAYYDTPYNTSLLSDGYIFGAPLSTQANTVPATLIAVAGGGGGGGGGQDTDNGVSGGVGGGGGGVILITATGVIELDSASAITANGGNGVNGQIAGNYRGGGGGGGGGGAIILTCNTLRLGPSIIVDSQVVSTKLSAHGGLAGTGSGQSSDGNYGKVIINTPNGCVTAGEITGDMIQNYPILK